MWFSWHLETYYAVLTWFWIYTLRDLFNSNTPIYGAKLNKKLQISLKWRKIQTYGNSSTNSIDSAR